VGKKNVLQIFSWALYDLANQFFALNVLSLYFVRWLTSEKRQPEIIYSLSFGASTLFVALFAPFLGSLSDQARRRRPFLVFFTLTAVIFTMLLAQGGVFLSLLFFMAANFACHSATIFYNAMMADITPAGRTGLVSGLGRMSGYIGAILALFLLKPVVLKSGYQAVFLPTGVLFLLFALPCMLFIKDNYPAGKISLAFFLDKERLRQAGAGLRTFLLNAKGSVQLMNFLKSIFFALCAVNVVVLFMAVYIASAFGLDESQIINLIGFSTFFAIVGSLFSGFLSDRLGHRFCLGVVFCLWIICFFAASLFKTMTGYWFVGGLCGFSLGAVWVISRALAFSLVPQERLAEMFGVFNLVNYFSSIAGAIFWGVIIFALSKFGQAGYRSALLSLVVFMAVALIFLVRCRKKN
jgi:UMF1 family MFS transporter